MATVNDEIVVHQLFSIPLGQYQIDFTEKEQKSLNKHCDLDYARYNCDVVDAGDGTTVRLDSSPPEERAKHPVWEDDFLTMYVDKNLLSLKEFSTLRKTISQIARHYVHAVWGMDIPPDCEFDVCDSWIVRQKASANYPAPFHRKHCHSFSWLTGVIYLDDTPNGTVIHNPYDDCAKVLFPFVWNRKTTPYNQNHFETEAKKGRVVIFPSSTHHSICNNQDGEVRHTLAFNIWPYGKLNNFTATKLEYLKKPEEAAIKEKDEVSSLPNDEQS